MKARLLLAMLCTSVIACGPDSAMELATEVSPETPTLTADACLLTVRNPIRTTSGVQGEASVSCAAKSDITLEVTTAGPATRTQLKTCYATTYCLLRVIAPYYKGSWQTRASVDTATNTIPPFLWSDYKVSSWVSL